jgi:uncharacterized protein YvpB
MKRVLLGIAIFLITLSAYVSGSPLRSTFAAVVERAMEREIGSPGWQPDARAFLFQVPFHRQEHALSCEVASLRSALLGIGVDVPEWDLWLELPKDPAPKTWTAERLVWGDPNRGFVGDVNGRMPSTGYGVFVEPLSSVANLHASSSRIRVDDPKAIDAALSKGYPIIVWSALGRSPFVTTWETPEGTEVKAPIYEHTLVVVGYRGSSDWIEGLYVIDSLTAIRYETWDEFQYRTSFFDHVGLEVAPKEG